MTTGNPTESVPGNQSAQQSRTLIRSLYRKRRPVWIVLGIVVFVVSYLAGLFVYPQTYTTMTSISLSQPDSGSSPLAVLAGGGGKAKYLGPLKSRLFAEQVEKAAHLKELYHLPTDDEAFEKLQRAVRFDDNAADGLLYISASLDAPAKMAPNSDATRKRVQNTVAIVCRAYAKALKDYIVNNDTDKDLVLLRSAEGMLKQKRAAYDFAVNKWISFVKDTKGTTLGGMSGSSSSQSPEIAAIQALFIKRGQLEVQIRSSDAALAKTKTLVGSATSTVGSIPTEDALLTEVRRKYEEAQRELQNLRIQYAEESPPIRRAKERLQVAESHMHQQAQSILKGNTSENIKRQALDVEYATVVSQIAQVERSIEVSKAAATSFERLHAEVELSLKVLEATATRQAELEIQTVSGGHRTNVVDEARPPAKSRPGMLMTLLVSGLLAILAVLAVFGIEYASVSSKLATQTVEPAVGGKQSEG